MSKDNFLTEVQEGYLFSGESLLLGVPSLDGEIKKGVEVKAPLSMMNRHGLIAGATGTGKTKSLQRFAEQLSENGVPSLVMDIKGDASGISQFGEESDKVKARQEGIGLPWIAKKFPVEFLTLGGSEGVKLRATVSEFGPILFSRMLSLNDTQEGQIAIIFKYCDDKGWPIVDLKDIKEIIKYLSDGEGKKDIEKNYGAISSASMGTIMRKIVELETQGAEEFFGETSFDVMDLVRTDSSGKGVVSILRLMNLMDRPKLFSTFMLSLLAELYAKLPEVGDVKKPKLVLFIDEAHLIFDEATKALLDQIEQVIKLIRSKGVGVYFITQNPIDIPDAVLAQLGMKFQHALRAFTAKDRESIEKAAKNFPESKYYKISETLTSMGVGEALVSVLNERGIPTPLVHIICNSPSSRMDIISDSEFNEINKNSSLVAKYKDIIDRESAFEVLSKKMEQIEQESPQSENKQGKVEKAKPTMVEELSKNTMVRQIGRSVMSEITRGILGAFGFGRRR
jgi:uncharacterized protein